MTKKPNARKGTENAPKGHNVPHETPRVKTPRELLADRVVKMIFDIGDIIDEHVEDSEAALDLTCKIHRYADQSGYLLYSSDETINEQYFQETEIMPQCPIKFTGGLENEPEYPLKALCPLIKCEDYSVCWAARSLNPPTCADYGDYPIA